MNGALMESWYRPRSCQPTRVKEREEKREEQTRNFDRAFLTLRESSLSKAPEGPGAPIDNANRSDSKTVDQESLFPRSWSESFFRPRSSSRAANYRWGKTDGRTSQVSANKTVVAREIRASFRFVSLVFLTKCANSRARWIGVLLQRKTAGEFVKNGFNPV